MLIAKFDTKNIESDIKAFEEKYEFSFPEEYRQLLIKYNGGKTPRSQFRINKISSNIVGFYGLGNAELNFSFFEKIDVLTDYLEDFVLPIGSNSFGDDIVIGIGPENYGKVFFYYHDRQKKYIELTDSLGHFVEKCKSEKLMPTRSIEERTASMVAKGRGELITDVLIKTWQDEIDESNLVQEELII